MKDVSGEIFLQQGFLLSEKTIFGGCVHVCKSCFTDYCINCICRFKCSKSKSCYIDVDCPAIFLEDYFK